MTKCQHRLATYDEMSAQADEGAQADFRELNTWIAFSPARQAMSATHASWANGQ
jgi:hypothetical protein